VVFDRGANEGEKSIIKEQMFDTNPSTFWECEYVKVYAPLQQAVEQSRELETLANNGQFQVVNGTLPLVTINDLRALAARETAMPNDDFEIEILVTLGAPQTINWISINPNNFDETAWLEVINIGTADSNSAGFRTIPGFHNDVFDNTITDYANAELTEGEAKAILSPNRYAYRGLGVWNFEAVTAKLIKIKMRQKTGVPNPYQRMAIRLHRVLQQTYTQSQGGGGMM